MKIKNQLRELDTFLQKWNEEYETKAKKITLFDKTLTSQWQDVQRKHFIKVFYHSRGHFSGFLFHLGNFAPNKILKNMILKNIEEEFSGDNPSHEQLYLDFASEEGVDLSNEYTANK